MTHVFEVAGHLRVDCRVTVGEIRLVATDAGQARVEVTPHGAGGEELIRRGEVAVHDDGGGRQRLVAHFPAKNLLSGMFSITGRGGVDVTIHCPVGSDLQARTGAAAVRAGLELGAVDIVTGAGDVELGRVSGPAAIKVTAAAGDVTIGSAEQGHVGVTATTGNIDIGVPPGRQLHLDVSSTIGSIRSELEASDDVGTGGADLSLRVRATTGDVTLRRVTEHAAPAG